MATTRLQEGQTKTVGGQHLVYTGDAWERDDAYYDRAAAPAVSSPAPAAAVVAAPPPAPVVNQGFYTPGMSAADYLAKDKAAFLPQTIAAIEGYYNGGGDGSLTYNPGTPEHLSTYANKNQAYTDWYDKAIASGQKFTPGAAPVYTPGMSSADYETAALLAYTPQTIAATPESWSGSVDAMEYSPATAAHTSVYAGDQGAYSDWYKAQEAENLKYLPAGWKGGSYGVDDESGDPAYLFGGPSSQYGSTYGDTSKDANANIAYRVVGGDSGGKTYQYAPYGKTGLLSAPETRYIGLGTDDAFGLLTKLGMAYVLGPLAGEIGGAVDTAMGGVATTAPSLGELGINTALTPGTLGAPAISTLGSTVGTAAVNAGTNVAQGQNLGDALTGAATNALVGAGTSGLSNVIGPDVTGSGNAFVNNVARDTLVSGGSGLLRAGLTGGDMGDALVQGLESGLAGSVVNTGANAVNSGLTQAGVTPQLANVLTGVGSVAARDAITGQELTADQVISAALAGGAKKIGAPASAPAAQVAQTFDSPQDIIAMVNGDLPNSEGYTANDAVDAQSRIDAGNGLLGANLDANAVGDLGTTDLGIGSVGGAAAADTGAVTRGLDAAAVGTGGDLGTTDLGIGSVSGGTPSGLDAVTAGDPATRQVVITGTGGDLGTTDLGIGSVSGGAPSGLDAVTAGDPATRQIVIRGTTDAGTGVLDTDTPGDYSTFGPGPDLMGPTPQRVDITGAKVLDTSSLEGSGGDVAAPAVAAPAVAAPAVAAPAVAAPPSVAAVAAPVAGPVAAPVASPVAAPAPKPTAAPSPLEAATKHLSTKVSAMDPLKPLALTQLTMPTVQDLYDYGKMPTYKDNAMDPTGLDAVSYYAGGGGVADSSETTTSTNPYAAQIEALKADTDRRQMDDLKESLTRLGAVTPSMTPTRHNIGTIGRSGVPILTQSASRPLTQMQVVPQLAALLRSRGMQLAEGGNVDRSHPNYDGNPTFRTGGLEGLGGKYVEGKGDGTSDDITAMLANGEYVFSADVVAALGNGSNKAGAAELDRMVREIRSRARSAPPDKLPPDAKAPLEYLKSNKGAK